MVMVSNKHARLLIHHATNFKASISQNEPILKCFEMQKVTASKSSREHAISFGIFGYTVIICIQTSHSQ